MKGFCKRVQRTDGGWLAKPVNASRTRSGLLLDFPVRSTPTGMMGRPKKLFRTSQKGAERVTIPGAIHLVFFLRGLCVAGQSCLLVATLIGRGTLNFGGSSLASGSGSQRRRGDGFITPFVFV